MIWRQLLNESVEIENPAERISIHSRTILKTVYRVTVWHVLSNDLQVRHFDSLDEATAAAMTYAHARREQRVHRFTQALGRVNRERAACVRAAAWLDNLALVLPTRIVNEDLGDVLEDINRRALQGQSSFKIYLRATSAMFWLIANAIGYLVRAVGARKSA